MRYAHVKVRRRKPRSTVWQDYENVARHLLNEIAETFGLTSVEGKQLLNNTKSGTSWEIDAKGIRSDGSGFTLVEIRRYATRRLNQESTAAIAYRIRDTRSKGGIIVTPLGLQSGAKKVAKRARLIDVRLEANSTIQSYVLRALNHARVGVFCESLQVGVSLISGTLETVVLDPAAPDA